MLIALNDHSWKKLVYNSDAHESPSELAIWNKFTQINCINFLSIISVWFARQFYDLNHQKKSNKVGENLPTREACWPAPSQTSSVGPSFTIIFTRIILFVKMLNLTQNCAELWSWQMPSSRIPMYQWLLIPNYYI